MKLHFNSFVKATLLLAALATTLTVAAQTKPNKYLSVGISQWSELTKNQSPREFVLGSNRGVEIGAGRSLTDRWSIEVTYTKFDELYEGEYIPTVPTITNTIRNSHLLTLSPLLEVPFSKYVSASVKAGAAWLRQDTKVSFTIDNERVDTKQSSLDHYLFASAGISVPIKEIRSVFELSLTRVFTAPDRFAQSVGFSWRAYF